MDVPDHWAWLRAKPFGSLLEAEALGTRMALCQSGVPCCMRMHNKGPRAAGSLMLLLEAATLFTGWLMGINPLDQPAVELGKRLANARLKYGTRRKRPIWRSILPYPEWNRIFKQFDGAGCSEGKKLAFRACCSPLPVCRNVLQELRWPPDGGFRICLGFL